MTPPLNSRGTRDATPPPPRSGQAVIQDRDRPVGLVTAAVCTPTAAYSIVALNRAIAGGEVQGPSAALALIDEVDLDTYYPFHATRADLLRRLGRDGEAAVPMSVQPP